MTEVKYLNIIEKNVVQAVLPVWRCVQNNASQCRQMRRLLISRSKYYEVYSVFEMCKSVSLYRFGIYQ